MLDINRIINIDGVVSCTYKVDSTLSMRVSVKCTKGALWLVGEELLRQKTIGCVYFGNFLIRTNVWIDWLCVEEKVEMEEISVRKTEKTDYEVYRERINNTHSLNPSHPLSSNDVADSLRYAYKDFLAGQTGIDNYRAWAKGPYEASPSPKDFVRSKIGTGGVDVDRQSKRSRGNKRDT